VSDIPRGDDTGQGKDYEANTPLVMEKLIRKVLPALMRQVATLPAAGKYTSVTSPYIRKEMAETDWEDRNRIDDLIKLQRYITQPPRGYAAGMSFTWAKDRRKREYLELLREHSEEEYEKELARRRDEKRRRAECIKQEVREERASHRDWIRAGGGE
jgi:hypothetical protein